MKRAFLQQANENRNEIFFIQYSDGMVFRHLPTKEMKKEVVSVEGKVVKFGGTSLCDVTQMKKAAEISGFVVAHTEAVPLY